MGLAGGETAKEQAVVGTGDAQLRTDVDATFSGRPGHDGLHIRTDIAVTSATKPTGLAAAAKRAGAAAQTRERVKIRKYAALCAPARFYGTVVETGGRLSSGFVAVLLCLATLFVSSAEGSDELNQDATDAAVAGQLQQHYNSTVSVGLQRAVHYALSGAAAHVGAMEHAPAHSSRRPRLLFRGRPATRRRLMTQILPKSSSRWRQGFIGWETGGAARS